jgi:YesN/AraC family two-component response regulator
VARVKEFVMKMVTGGPHVPGVLVVDDEPLMRSFLREALEARVRVVEAQDSEQAIEILQKFAREQVDLVLADYVLPTRSGLDLLQITKRRWPWIPVVIVTAFGSEELAVQALRGGASDYLRKPIPLDALLHTVGTLTARSNRTSENDGSAGGGNDTGRAVHPNIERALSFMRKHFARAITLTDVAREAGLSRFHFCRLFHHETGVPFHEYLHAVRVAQAKELLAADRYLRVSEVAYAVGFNDLSHFDRTFRKMVGHSPSEYRKSLRCA